MANTIVNKPVPPSTAADTESRDGSARLDKILQTGITFDDVLIEPRYSDVVPAQVDTSTQ